MQAINQKLYVAKKKHWKCIEQFCEQKKIRALWCPGDDHFVIQGDYFGKHFLGPSKSGSPGVHGSKVCVIQEALGCFLAQFWRPAGSREAPQIELFGVKSFQNL